MSFLRQLLGRPHAVGPAEASRLLAEGAVLLDVREPAEFRAGHVRGAVHVPLDRVLAGGTSRLPRGAPVITACRGGARSARAAAALRRAGVEVVNLRGGLLGWHRAGLPLEDSRGRPGSVV